MKTLRSYVCGGWHEPTSDTVPLVNPSTEEEIARLSSHGVNFAEVVNLGREHGGPALRAKSFAERGALLKTIAKALREHRDELLNLSRRNNGTTAGDGAFDVDGATGTLAFYASLAKTLGDRSTLVDGDELRLSREGGFRGRHLWVPRQGVAVHVNAFNFPAWGFAEKFACALLAGMPVITKPASATALVTHRCVEIVLDSGTLPSGALQLICGSTGDLLDRLGPQDVLAFTGSAETGLVLRQRAQARSASARFNVEADSLNAAVLGPDVGLDTVTMRLFLRDVVREMTQKAGQKCTAVRRILVPEEVAESVQESLAGLLSQVVVGNPADERVTMGPLATARQLASSLEGVSELRREARLVQGSGRRVDGVGSPAGKGFFLGPTLLRVDNPGEAEIVHLREVFAPVATLLPYDGSALQAAVLMARGGGTLVTSVYSDDREWLLDFLARGGAATGRVYMGSEETADDAPGSGIALPQALHGGPGRAGGGEELGGLIGVQLYLQRLAVQGGRSLIGSLDEGSDSGD